MFPWPSSAYFLPKLRRLPKPYKNFPDLSFSSSSLSHPQNLRKQNAWAVFLLYVAASKYGNIKLGKAHEKPEFNNISWFSMLFSCGIAVGVYTYGVAEPMDYYRGGYNLAGRGPLYNDDDRAQLAMMQVRGVVFPKSQHCLPIQD